MANNEHEKKPGSPTDVIWHGTQTETFELLSALSHNCSCVVTAEGVRLTTCAPHKILVEDQRAVDGLLFYRRIAERLRAEEFDPSVYDSNPGNNTGSVQNQPGS